MKKFLCLLAAVALVFIFTACSQSGELEKLQQQMEAMQSQLEQLQQQNEDLKNQLEASG